MSELKNEFDRSFVGAAGAFDTSHQLATLRLDPEGIAVSATGTFFVSDEYGPAVFEFDRQGNIVRRLDLPSDFLIANPNADPNQELLGNLVGRQANRGMEGLAISPDGDTLFGIMQNALLQDNALTPGTKRSAADPRTSTTGPLPTYASALPRTVARPRLKIRAPSGSLRMNQTRRNKRRLSWRQRKKLCRSALSFPP
jgi:hypothetical protein